MPTTENLPGYKEAPILGYTLLHHSGDYRSATYVNKTGIWLTLHYNKENRVIGDLSFSPRGTLAMVKIDDFSFPHKMFGRWQQYLTHAQEALRMVNWL